jgi:hypothetical protein
VARAHRELVATVLVAPRTVRELQLALMARDLWAWPMESAPVLGDGPRQAAQYRRRVLTAHRGAWDDAADWVPVWVSFGQSWQRGDEPLPWVAHASLWEALEEFVDTVRYRRRLSGVPRLPVPHGIEAVRDQAPPGTPGRRSRERGT